VQSQDYLNAKWALAQRLDAATEADLDRAFDAGTFVRSHVMRPTWHFIAPEDLRWLLALTAPRVHRANGYQYRALELDASVRARTRSIIERALRGGYALTRAELVGRLAAEGVDGAPLRWAYILFDAELAGLICSGPRRGRQQTYALLEERLPPARPRAPEEALAELARRYVDGHGPAQVADLAWWSGLTITDARTALESATPPLVRERVGDRTFFRSPTSRATPAHWPQVHLLPNYDELLVAFRDRTDALDARLPAEMRVAQVILGHVVVRDGLVVGRFRRREERRSTRLDLDVAVRLTSAALEALRASVGRFEGFIGRPVEVAGLG
jgi:Winged helix DNA-binding domain